MKLVMATRKSPLALAQSRAFARQLEAAHPGLWVEELLITTSGDRFLAAPLQDLGGKGLFIKELEEALMDGRADFAVHSIKDVPAELPAGFSIACVPEREDPRDVMVSTAANVAELRPGSRVGSSSLRRQMFLQTLRPDIKVVPVRGNVGTRLDKVHNGEVDAVLLALAGLKRLGLAERASYVFPTMEMVPAAGQGALGIEIRVDRADLKSVLEPLHHPETDACVAAERAVLLAIGGSCRAPIAAFGERQGASLSLRAAAAQADLTRERRAEVIVPFPHSSEEATVIGKRLAEKLQ